MTTMFNSVLGVGATAAAAPFAEAPSERLSRCDERKLGFLHLGLMSLITHMHKAFISTHYARKIRHVHFNTHAESLSLQPFSSRFFKHWAAPEVGTNA